MAENVVACLNIEEKMDGMRTLSVQYPVAIKLFELGRLTSGQAAVMAGVPRAAFLLQCHRFGVFSAEWSDEEFAHEFRTAV